MATKATKNATKKVAIKDVLTEDEVQQYLGVTSDQIKDLRNKRNFPFVKVTSTKRVYLVPDIMAWFRKNRENIPVTES